MATLIANENHNMQSYDNVKKKQIYKELDVYRRYAARSSCTQTGGTCNEAFELYA